MAGAFLAFGVGYPLGIFAGYFDGRQGPHAMLSLAMLRLMDVLQSFPIFVLGLLLVAIYGPHPINLILLIGLSNLPGNLRMARTEAITIREKAFVDAARAAGASELRIAFSHIAPNALAPVISLLSVVMGFGILLIAGLSFVGAGIRAPTPEWGSMIAIGGKTMITGQWWPSVFPGLVMAITVFGFSMVGQIITAFVDPLERVVFDQRNEQGVTS
jgi:peptide/nickel transport system permease protein